MSERVCKSEILFTTYLTSDTVLENSWWFKPAQSTVIQSESGSSQTPEIMFITHTCFSTSVATLACFDFDLFEPIYTFSIICKNL